jgi:hypothetical protein
MTPVVRFNIALLILLPPFACSATHEPPRVAATAQMTPTKPASEPEHAKLPAEYRKGQMLRLRRDGFAYRWKQVQHPAEAGVQITVPRSAKLNDATARAEWEPSTQRQLIARLPVGTVFRVERVETVSTIDTAIIVAYGIIVDGALRGQAISLSGVSIDDPQSGYPYKVAPDTSVVEIVPAE